MPSTDSYFLADTPMNDLEIFVGGTEWKDLNSGNGQINIVAGYLCFQVNSFVTSHTYASVSAALKKTGFRPSAAIAQQQFGSSVPGQPSNPDGTSGYPPFTAAQLSTTKGSMLGSAINPGPVPKGIMINSMDVVYTPSGGSVSATQASLAAVNFTDNAAPVVNFLIPLGAYNLQNSPPAAGVWRTNIPTVNPSFVVLPDTELVINVTSTTAANQFLLVGCVLKCSYNFN